MTPTLHGWPPRDGALRPLRTIPFTTMPGLSSGTAERGATGFTSQSWKNAQVGRPGHHTWELSYYRSPHIRCSEVTNINVCSKSTGWPGTPHVVPTALEGWEVPCRVHPHRLAVAGEGWPGLRFDWTTGTWPGRRARASRVASDDHAALAVLPDEDPAGTYPGRHHWPHQGCPGSL